MSGILQVMLAARAATGGSANYWNPSDKAAEITLSAANATATRSSTNNNNWRMVRSVTSHNTGKWYAECVNVANGAFNGSMMFGLATAGVSLNNFVGQDSTSWGVHANNAGGTRTYNNNVDTNLAFAAVLAPGGVAHVAVDIDAGKLWLGLNGTYPSSGSPAAGTNPTYTFAAGTSLLVALSEYSASQQCTLKNNAGENTLALPAGFSMFA